MAEYGAHSLRILESRRIRLVSATSGLVAADLSGHQALAEVLDARVADNWPPELYGRLSMELARDQLRDPSEQGWSFWYLVSKEGPEAELLGISSFKGRPGAAGSVEVTYSILQQFRNRGYATEAVACLIGWAFSHNNVVEVCAETLPHLKQSIRVLEKNGFSYAGAGSEYGVVRYAVSRARLN